VSGAYSGKAYLIFQVKTKIPVAIGTGLCILYGLQYILCG